MKFIFTKELGRLVKWMRILGYDTVYFKQNSPSTLIIQALRDGRVIATRSQRLVRPVGIKTVLIKSEKVKEQIKELLDVLDLKVDRKLMFSRCIVCNVLLEEIGKEEVKDKVPEYVFQNQEEFIVCPMCKRIYWEGTHWGNVKEILEGIVK